MEFNIINTEAIYRRMLAAQSAAEREKIFCDELVEPFDGLVRMFGGDGLAMFKDWGMSPGQFGGEQREQFAQIVEGLAAGDAWNRSAAGLRRGWAAFEQYHDRIPTPSITFALTIADMSHMPVQHGYSGFGAMPGRRTWKISGTPASYERPAAWTMTAADVVTGGLERYVENVRAWARSVYEALNH